MPSRRARFLLWGGCRDRLDDVEPYKAPGGIGEVETANNLDPLADEAGGVLSGYERNPVLPPVLDDVVTPRWLLAEHADGPHDLDGLAEIGVLVGGQLSQRDRGRG